MSFEVLCILKMKATGVAEDCGADVRQLANRPRPKQRAGGLGISESGWADDGAAEQAKHPWKSHGDAA
eukprot:2010137-Alexandrium_andersonii.AAC.1